MYKRLGKHERARVKKVNRSESIHVVGRAGSYHVKAGRKKYFKVCHWLDRIVTSHRNGDSILKSGTVSKRRLYTLTVN